MSVCLSVCLCRKVVTARVCIKKCQLYNIFKILGRGINNNREARPLNNNLSQPQQPTDLEQVVVTTPHHQENIYVLLLLK